MDNDKKAEVLLYLRTLSDAFVFTVKLTEEVVQYDVSDINFETLLDSIFLDYRNE